MSVEDIIVMLANPATIDEALLEAAKLTFRGEDKVRFKQKQQQYIDGLSDHERPRWVGEMNIFLSLYDDSSDDDSPEDDSLESCPQWYHLDKKNLKNAFRDLCLNQKQKVKVVLIEPNLNAYSLQLHNILHSYYRHEFRQPQSRIKGSIKGSMDDYLNIVNKKDREKHFMHYMRKYFGITNVALTQIPATFKKKEERKPETHFIVQKVISDFNFSDFNKYYKLWASLQPEKPVVLFIHVKELPKVSEHFPGLSNYCLCRCHEHEQVDGEDFQALFGGKSFEPGYIKLCNCDPMTFADAVEKLQFFENSEDESNNGKI